MGDSTTSNYMIKKWLLVTSYFLLATFSGCGYTFHSNLPTHIEKVYVENFDNKIDFSKGSSNYSSYFPGLETDISEAVENRFLMEGSLGVADSKKNADIFLSGSLLNYIKQPIRYTGEKVEEYRLSIVVKCKLKDLKNGRVMWKEKIIGDNTYFITGSLAETETEAIDGAVEDLARRIVEKTVVVW